MRIIDGNPDGVKRQGNSARAWIAVSHVDQLPVCASRCLRHYFTRQSSGRVRRVEFSLFLEWS